MRNFVSVLFASILCVLLLTKCDSFLEAQPQGQLDGETFYNNESDFNGAMYGAYSTLLNYHYEQFGSGWIQPVILPSDDIRNESRNNDLDVFNWQPSTFTGMWNTSYKGILRCNTVLEQLPDSELNDDLRTRFEAEAKFLRAWFHFLLARNFGNAPVVDEVIQSVSEANIGKSEPGAIWDLVESDLEFASQNLPDSWPEAQVGRANRYSAYALLGKARLFRAQWTQSTEDPADPQTKYSEAVSALDEVVTSGNFELVDNYRDNFSTETENNAESLFEIQMSRGDFNPWLPVDHPAGVGAAGSGRIIATGASCYQGNCAPGANAYGYGEAHITEPLQNEFEPNDPRRYFTYYEQGETYPSEEEDRSEPWNTDWSITGHTPSKYVRSDMDLSRFPLNVSTDNERVIRYSDVLLMLAEAELQANSNVSRAAELVNMVRERARNNHDEAFGTPAPSGTLPDRSETASESQMMEWIMHERRVELAVEGHRYDDLVRWHRAGIINIPSDIDFGQSAANSGWQPRNVLKPIPQDEIDNNSNLTQHEEYSTAG